MVLGPSSTSNDLLFTKPSWIEWRKARVKRWKRIYEWRWTFLTIAQSHTVAISLLWIKYCCLFLWFPTKPPPASVHRKIFQSGRRRDKDVDSWNNRRKQMENHRRLEAETLPRTFPLTPREIYRFYRCVSPVKIIFFQTWFNPTPEITRRHILCSTVLQVQCTFPFFRLECNFSQTPPKKKPENYSFRKVHVITRAQEGYLIFLKYSY